MATIIQGIECYLFREYIDWDGREDLKHNIMRFAMFASCVYIRYWNTTSNLFDAPKNDLNFLQELQNYQLIDFPVAKTAIKALNRHLYYMSEELAPLSLFSNKVSNADKDMIAEKLISTRDKIMPTRRLDGRNVSNHILYSDGIIDENLDWSSRNVTDFIGDRSNFFFDAMDLPRNFLRLSAREWNKDRDYVRAKKIVQNTLICINDASERVISKCKNKFSKQRCRRESTFRQNMLSLNNFED